MTALRELDGAHVYLDSNVLIYAFEGASGPTREVCAALLRAIHAQRCRGGTSLLSRAEVMVGPLRRGQTELADRYRMLLSGAGPIEIHALDSMVVDQAAELRAHYPTLRLPDALHAATALRARFDVLVSSDQGLRVVTSRIAVVALDSIEPA